jgi:hypothetical protein
MLRPDSAYILVMVPSRRPPRNGVHVCCAASQIGVRHRSEHLRVVPRSDGIQQFRGMALEADAVDRHALCLKVLHEGVAPGWNGTVAT